MWAVLHEAFPIRSSEMVIIHMDLLMVAGHPISNTFYPPGLKDATSARNVAPVHFHIKPEWLASSNGFWE